MSGEGCFTGMQNPYKGYDHYNAYRVANQLPPSFPGASNSIDPYTQCLLCNYSQCPFPNPFYPFCPPYSVLGPCNQCYNPCGCCNPNTPCEQVIKQTAPNIPPSQGDPPQPLGKSLSQKMGYCPWCPCNPIQGEANTNAASSTNLPPRCPVWVPPCNTSQPQLPCCVPPCNPYIQPNCCPIPPTSYPPQSNSAPFPPYGTPINRNADLTNEKGTGKTKWKFPFL